jgi:hypothetical protein
MFFLFQFDILPKLLSRILFLFPDNLDDTLDMIIRMKLDKKIIAMFSKVGRICFPKMVEQMFHAEQFLMVF